MATTVFFTHDNPKVQQAIVTFLENDEKFVNEVNKRKLAQDERAMSLSAEVNQIIWQIRKEHIHNSTTDTIKFGPLLSDESILEILKPCTQKLQEFLKTIDKANFKFQQASSETSSSYMNSSPTKCSQICTKFNRQVCN